MGPNTAPSQRRPRPCYLSRRLVPSTPARVPRPRRLCPSNNWGPLPGPANAGRDLRPRPLTVSATPPTPGQSSATESSGLLSHCDGTRGGKRDKAAARKVSLLVWLTSVALRTTTHTTMHKPQRCLARFWEERVEVSRVLNTTHHHHQAQPNLPRQGWTTDKLSPPALPHAFGVPNVIFNSFFSSPSSSLPCGLHASRWGEETKLDVWEP